jgi:signal transduction histidine kinase
LEHDALLVRSLESHRGFERLLEDLSRSLTNTGPEALDRQVRDGLGRLAARAGVERGSLARFSEAGDSLMVTHSFGAPAIPPRFRGNLRWYLEQLRRGRCLTMNQLPADLPDDATAEREVFHSMRIRSHVAVPLFRADRIWGVIALATSRQRWWMPEDVQRLRVVGDIIAAAVQRNEAEEMASRLRAELVHVARVSALGDVTVALTHQLIQPLTAIRSNAEATKRLLARGVGADELDEALAGIVMDASRAADLINRLANLFRRRALDRVRVDMNQLIRDFHVTAYAGAQQHGSKLVLRLLPDLPLALGDPVQIEQVVLNLVRNAAAALTNVEQSAREVVVSTSMTAPGQIIVSVEDSGPAIDDAAFKQLFRPFYTTKPDGLGMGLAVSRSIVEAHGGRIWAERRVPRGLAMHFTLPYDAVPAAADGPVHFSAANDLVSHPHRPTRRHEEA